MRLCWRINAYVTIYCKNCIATSLTYLPPCLRRAWPPLSRVRTWGWHRPGQMSPVSSPHLTSHNNTQYNRPAIQKNSYFIISLFLIFSWTKYFWSSKYFYTKLYFNSELLYIFSRGYFYLFHLSSDLASLIIPDIFVVWCCLWSGEPSVTSPASDDSSQPRDNCAQTRIFPFRGLRLIRSVNTEQPVMLWCSSSPGVITEVSGLMVRGWAIVQTGEWIVFKEVHGLPLIKTLLSWIWSEDLIGMIWPPDRPRQE